MRDPADPPSFRTHESNGQGMMLRGIDPTCATRPAWEQGQAADGTVLEESVVDALASQPMGGGMSMGGAMAMGGKM